MGDADVRADLLNGGSRIKEARMKPALLVVDVQKALFKLSPATAQSLYDAIEYINAAIALFR